MPPCAKPISAKKKAPAMTEAPLLEVADIETSYGLGRVLFGISLAVGSGEMVSLMGRNGMGKTMVDHLHSSAAAATRREGLPHSQ